MANTNSSITVKVISILIILIAFAAYTYIESESSIIKNLVPEAKFTFSETGSDYKYDFDSQADFYSPRAGSFYIITKDGARLATADGKFKWDYVFSMIAPIVVGEGEYIAVAEFKGKEIYVFDQKGLFYKKSLEFPILSFSLNTKGDLALILKNGEMYKIMALNGSNDNLFLREQKNENIIPLSVDISNDSRIIAYSLLDINYAIESSVSFAYTFIVEEGKNYSDSVFGWKKKEDQIVNVVKFMDKNSIILASESEISLMSFSAPNHVEEKWAIPLKNKLEHLTFILGRGFALTYGDRLINKEGAEPGKIEFYNLDAEKTGEFSKNDRISSIYADSSGNILASIGRSFYALNSRGALIWEHTMTQDIKKAFFLEGTNQLVMATNTKAQVIKRVKTKDLKPKEEAEPDTEPDTESEITDAAQ